MPFVSSDSSLGYSAMLPANWMPKSNPKIPSFRDDEVKNGIQAPHVASNSEKEFFSHNSNTINALRRCFTPKKTGGVTVYGYRHYSPQTGQFLGRDPIGENGGNNLYGFVGNDGVDVCDLLGHKFVEEGVKIVNSMYENQYGHANASILLKLTCKNNNGTWYIVKQELEGRAWIIISKNAIRYQDTDHNIREYIPYPESSISRTTKHEELHVNHFKEEYDRIESRVDYWTKEPWCTQIECKSGAETFMDLSKASWKMVRQSEIEHTHSDFSGYKRVKLSSVINFELGKGWIYEASDAKYGYKADSPNDVFNYVE
jgi:RHS repeat-associated protein